MTESREYFVQADAILTAKGFVRNKALHIKNEIIAGVPDASSHDTGVHVREYPGQLITPCFCDYHLHFFNNRHRAVTAIAEDLNAWGITAVWEGGDKNRAGLKAKEQLEGRLHIKTAGQAIYKKGTYGQYIGKGVSDVSEAGDLIRQLKKEGAGYIKVINSGIFQPETGAITTGGFQAEELNTIVRLAEDNGCKVACHVNGDHAVRESVEAGVSTIIHGLYISEETLSFMAERGTAFLPTVNAFMSLHSIAVDRESKKTVLEAVENHMEAVRLAYVKGVTLLPGSDAGPAFIPYGKSYHDELILWQKAGLPLEHILSSAAVAPFKEGQKAAFLVMDGLTVKQVFRGRVQGTGTSGD